MVRLTQKIIPSPPPGKRAFTLADGSQLWMPAHFVVELLPSVGDSVSVYSVRDRRVWFSIYPSAKDRRSGQFPPSRNPPAPRYAGNDNPGWAENIPPRAMPTEPPK